MPKWFSTLFDNFRAAPIFPAPFWGALINKRWREVNTEVKLRLKWGAGICSPYQTRTTVWKPLFTDPASAKGSTERGFRALFCFVLKTNRKKSEHIERNRNKSGISEKQGTQGRVSTTSYTTTRDRKSAISGRRLHWIFLNFLQCIFSFSPGCWCNLVRKIAQKMWRKIARSPGGEKKRRILSRFWLSWTKVFFSVPRNASRNRSEENGEFGWIRERKKHIKRKQIREIVPGLGGWHNFCLCVFLALIRNWGEHRNKIPQRIPWQSREKYVYPFLFFVGFFRSQLEKIDFGLQPSMPSDTKNSRIIIFEKITNLACNSLKMSSFLQDCRGTKFLQILENTYMGSYFCIAIGAKIITRTTFIAGELILQLQTHQLHNFNCRGIKFVMRVYLCCLLVLPLLYYRKAITQQ